MSSSTPQTQHPHTLPTPSARRLPPPCWSHDETVALIDVYREKWYSLRRGNLRASHWQEVAENVAVRCPLPYTTPQKTSVQCRHKMEKLRKRYRTEIQRAVMIPNTQRYCSSWIHFNRMDAMEKGYVLPEKGFISSDNVVTFNTQQRFRDDDVEDVEEEDGDEEKEDFYGHVANNVVGGKSCARPVRTRIRGGRNAATGMSMPVLPTTKAYNKFNEFSTIYGHLPTINSGRFGMERNGGSGSGGGGGRKRKEGNQLDGMVEAINMLGDGYAKMERMKMDMAREIEGMRMEMEMKRTEMILESQQKVVETFSKVISETSKNKKVKRMPSPES